VVRPRALIKEPKSVVDAGRWDRGRIPSAAFPLVQAPIRLGRAWHWRVLRLRGDNSPHRSYRLLLAYRTDAPAVWMWLAREHPEGLVVVARLEDHHRPGESGLHCHAACGDDAETPLGAQFHPGMIRVPAYGRRHNRTVACTAEAILRTAFRFFSVTTGWDGRS